MAKNDKKTQVTDPLEASKIQDKPGFEEHKAEEGAQHAPPPTPSPVLSHGELQQRDADKAEANRAASEEHGSKVVTGPDTHAPTAGFVGKETVGEQQLKAARDQAEKDGKHPAEAHGPVKQFRVKEDTQVSIGGTITKLKKDAIVSEDIHGPDGVKAIQSAGVKLEEVKKEG